MKITRERKYAVFNIKLITSMEFHEISNSFLTKLNMSYKQHEYIDYRSYLNYKII